MNYILIALVAMVLYFLFMKQETFLFWRAPESGIHDNIVDLDRKG